MDYRQDSREFLNILVGSVLYFISFIYYLVYPDINFLDRISYFIAIGSLGWLFYEAVKSEYDMLIRAIFVAPIFFFIIFINSARFSGYRQMSMLFDPNQMTVYLAIACLSIPFAIFLRKTRKREAGRYAGSNPGNTSYSGYDPYGNTSGGQYGSTYSRNSDLDSDAYYEPRSQYRKDTDYQYYGSTGGGSSFNEDFANPSSFKNTKFTPELIKGVFTALGYLLNKCSSNEDLQLMFIDELADRLGLSDEEAAAGKKHIEEGRKSTLWNVKLCIRESGILLNDSKLAAAVFFSIAGSLFYDELVTQTESQMFSQVAAAFQISPDLAGAIFNRLVKDYNLYFDNKSGTYKAYGFNSGRNYSFDEDDENYESRKKEAAEEYSDKEIRNAYLTLQVKPAASNSEVKSSYRRMIARYHPDKAISKGLSEKEIEKYNEITQKLNIAWDIIRTVRNL